MAESNTSPSSQIEKADNSFRLQCTDCSLDTTVDGDAMDALDVADEHMEEYGGVAMDHFVDVHRVTE